MNRKLFSSLVLILVLFSSFSVFAQTTKIDTAYYDLDKPFTISLSNKNIAQDWEFLEADNKGLELVSKRNGYLFTYLTVKMSDPSVKSVVFTSKDSNGNPLSRSFVLKPLNSTNPPLKQEIYGDIPSISHSDGFLSQANNSKFEQQPNLATTPPQNPQTITPDATSVTAAPSPSLTDNNNTQQGAQIPSTATKTNLDPIATKQYVQTLMDNKLYGQARNIFDEFSKQSNVDENWKTLTDLRISRLSGNYQEIVDKADKMLEKNIPSKETEIAIRIQKAKALEKLGKLDEAESNLLYIHSYFPENSESYSQLADFYIRNKQENKALKELTYISAQFNNNLQDLDKIYYQLGNCYYKVMGADGYSIALGYYKKVLGFGISSPYYKNSKKLVDFLENNLLNYQ